MVSYNRLFDDDDDMNQGICVECFRSQHLNERLDFLQVRHSMAWHGAASVLQLTVTIRPKSLRAYRLFSHFVSWQLSAEPRTSAVRAADADASLRRFACGMCQRK